MLNSISIAFLWLAIFTGSSVFAKSSTQVDSAEHAQKVVFIYQKDPGSNFEYYVKAAQYYQQQHSFIVVTDVTSVEFIHRWLNKSAELRQIPWKEIHIVTHGSFQKGISLPVMEGRPRKKNHIISFDGSEKLSRLPSNVIDTKTQLKILSCGIGRHAATVNGLKKMFESQLNERPVVTASMGYHFFESDRLDPAKVSSFELGFYSAIVTKSVEWDVGKIAELFHKQYPDSKIDWQQAIKNQTKYDPVNPFSMKKPLELSVLAYKDDLSRLGSVKKYVKKHPQLSETLDSHLIIGRLKFDQKDYSKQLVRLTTEVFSLKIFYPRLKPVLSQD